MLVSLRREYAHLVTSGAQLLLLLAGIYLHTRNGWLTCFSIMAAISILAWLSALNRLRTIRDTPTSKIASAAQGYVELAGRGHPFGDPLLGQLSRLPCLWYRYKIEQRDSENDWSTTDKGESDGTFILRDETGECVVDPEHAEILTRHCDKWRDGDYRYTEWKLIEHDNLYIIGQFRTQGGNSVEFDTNEELSALLAEWKKDMPALLKRFDLDNDGTLDMQEWMLTRSAARREVAKMMREEQEQPDINIISRPREGELFLISNLDQDKLSRRYLLWSWVHLAIFFGALFGIGWVLNHPPFSLTKKKGRVLNPPCPVRDQSFLRSIIRSIKPSFMKNWCLIAPSMWITASAISTLTSCSCISWENTSLKPCSFGSKFASNANNAAPALLLRMINIPVTGNRNSTAYIRC